MNSKNNLEMNNKIEICNEGKKAYDIVLRVLCRPPGPDGIP